MAGEADARIERLELEIKELKDQLASGRSRRSVADIKPEDLQAYVRVRDVIAADIDDCGINECFRCSICRICRACEVCAICRACVVECSCGPCNIGGGGLRGSLSRFRELGE